MRNCKLKMKINLIGLFFCTFSLLSASASASDIKKTNKQKERKDTNIIKCLAQEESIIHKNKVNGPIYSLNKELLNELVIDESISVKEKYLKEICSFKEFSPSVFLLQHLLIEGKEIFSINDNQSNSSNVFEDQTEKPRALYLIDNLMDLAPSLFINYLMELQNMTPSATCLEVKIPELAKYLQNYQYLEEEEYAGTKIVFDKEKIKIIFEKLKNFDKIYKECLSMKKTQKSLLQNNAEEAVPSKSSKPSKPSKSRK
ncbi:MAG: hypothetical protein HQK49_03770 [Oligoflexia bacterium]|nr:hypothetical protein [Oligoflexia bacterium]